VNERTQAFEDIAAELRVLGRRFKTIVAQRAAEVHPQLQPSSYYILTFLVENGPTRGSALACQFDIDKGAISRQVQHLVDLDLAERTADPEDGRAQLVSASARAIELIDAGNAEQKVKWQRGLSDWSEAELQSFALQLGRFNTDLG
jgi:DNA-binding MarR family transcriptional regulator